MVRPEGSWLLEKGDEGTWEQGTRSGRLWLRKGRHVIYIYKNTHNPLPIFLYNLKRKCNLWRKLSLLALQKRFLFFSSRHHTLLFAVWSGVTRSGGVGFFCFHALGDTKQKKPTPLDRGPPRHVNRVLMSALRKAERGQFVHVCCCWNYGDFLICYTKHVFSKLLPKVTIFIEVFAFNPPIIPILKHLSNWAHGIFPRDFTWWKVKYSVNF